MKTDYFILHSVSLQPISELNDTIVQFFLTAQYGQITPVEKDLPLYFLKPLCKCN